MFSSLSKLLTARSFPNFFANSTKIHTMMIETKHLSKGSSNPPLTTGLLRVYNMRFCPYAQRILLVLDSKKVPYEVVNVDLNEKPEWLFEKSPLGKVPAIEIDGKILFESLIIAEYLEETYPQQALLPKDPYLRALDRILIDGFNKVISFFLGMLLNPEKMNLEFLEKLWVSLEVFEKELTSRKQAFFGGGAPNLVDLMIWPWFERIDLLGLMAGTDYEVPVKRFPKLMDWISAMKANDGVKGSLLSIDYHAKYLNSRMAGHPDYDMLVPSSNL